MNMHASNVNADWKAEAQTVTPEMAAQILDASNRGNRKLRPGVVSKYAAMMKNGDWKLSPEPIVLSATNRLLNGQHRLSAVVQSGQPCNFFVIRGVADETFSVLDRGAGRNVADALGIERRLAEEAKLACEMKRHFDRSLTVDDFTVRRAAHILEPAHDLLHGYAPRSAKLFSSTPFRLAAMAHITASPDCERVLRMYRNFTLSNIEELPPVGVAAVRAYMSGTLSTGGGGDRQRKLLCVAWGIFSPEKEGNTKLTWGNPSRDVPKIIAALGV